MLEVCRLKSQRRWDAAEAAPGCCLLAFPCLTLLRLTCSPAIRSLLIRGLYCFASWLIVRATLTHSLAGSVTHSLARSLFFLSHALVYSVTSSPSLTRPLPSPRHLCPLPPSLSLLSLTHLLGPFLSLTHSFTTHPLPSSLTKSSTPLTHWAVTHYY